MRRAKPRRAHISAPSSRLARVRYPARSTTTWHSSSAQLHEVLCTAGPPESPTPAVNAHLAPPRRRRGIADHVKGLLLTDSVPSKSDTPPPALSSKNDPKRWTTSTPRFTEVPMIA